MTTWNMESHSATWQTKAAAIVSMEVAEHQQRGGLATFLNGEVLRHIAVVVVDKITAAVVVQGLGRGRSGECARRHGREGQGGQPASVRIQLQASRTA